MSKRKNKFKKEIIELILIIILLALPIIFSQTNITGFTTFSISPIEDLTITKEKDAGFTIQPIEEIEIKKENKTTNLEITALPVVGSVILNSTDLTTNNTLQNLTCWNLSVTDADADTIKTIFNWYKNDVSIMTVNMPFEGHNTSLNDYTTYDNYGSTGPIIFNIFETFDEDDWSQGDAWSERDGNWQEPKADYNTVGIGFRSVNTTDTSGGNGSIYVTAEYGVKPPTGTVYSSSNAYIDLWYRCELGARWGILVYNDSWNCIKGSGNITCGRDYNPIGNLTPNIACDDTWRHTEYNMSKYFPGETIKETIIGDYDRINTSNQNKFMWFDNFQIYNITESPVWNSSGGYDSLGAYKFDGIDDFISLNDRGMYDFNAVQFTLSVWIKTNNSNNGVFVSTYTNFPTWAGFDLYHNSSGNVLILTTNSPGLESTTKVNDNNWHHIVFRQNNSGLPLIADGEAQLFIDGNLEDIVTNFIIHEKPPNLYLGERSGGGQNFNGTIDDFKIYNHSLSDKQINLLYENKHWIIHSEETTRREEWKCSSTPNDGKDAGNEVNSSILTILNSNPEIYLRSPLNNTNSTTQLTEFIYNVTDIDGNEIDNCTLWIENSTGLAKAAINTSIIIDQNISEIITLDYEEINWLVGCTDNSNDKANSSTWIYTVIQPPAVSSGGGISHGHFIKIISPEPEKEEKEPKIPKEEKIEKEIEPAIKENIFKRIILLFKRLIQYILTSLLFTLFIIYYLKPIKIKHKINKRRKPKNKHEFRHLHRKKKKY